MSCTGGSQATLSISRHKGNSIHVRLAERLYVVTRCSRLASLSSMPLADDSGQARTLILSFHKRAVAMQKSLRHAQCAECTLLPLPQQEAAEQNACGIDGPASAPALARLMIWEPPFV